MDRSELCGMQYFENLTVPSPIPAGETFFGEWDKLDGTQMFQACAFLFWLDGATTTATQWDIIVQDSDMNGEMAEWEDVKSCKCGNPLLGKSFGGNAEGDCIPLVDPNDPAVGRHIEWHPLLNATRRYYRLKFVTDGDVAITTAVKQSYCPARFPVSRPEDAWSTKS